MAQVKRVLKNPDKSGKFARSELKSVVTGVHVAPESKGWAVKKSGEAKVSSHFKNQKDAVKFAREVARDNDVEVFIHRKDGSVSRENGSSNKPR